MLSGVVTPNKSGIPQKKAADRLVRRLFYLWVLSPGVISPILAFTLLSFVHDPSYSHNHDKPLICMWFAHPVIPGGDDPVARPGKLDADC